MIIKRFIQPEMFSCLAFYKYIKVEPNKVYTGSHHIGNVDPKRRGVLRIKIKRVN